MIYHLLALVNEFKTYVQIKTFQKSFNVSKKLGQKVLVPSKSEKILIVIAHVVTAQASKDPEKLARLVACIDALGLSLASYPHQIVLLTKEGYTIHNQLPAYLLNRVEVFYSEQTDPMHVEFDALEVFKAHLESYDYFMFIEDDIIISDSWFLNKIKQFNRISPFSNYILLPHRFEYYKGVKYYLDQVVTHDKQSSNYTYSDLLKVTHNEIEFCFYENPHAAFYCLTRQQINQWVASGYKWKNKVVAFGPLESAATFCMFENFKFMKPHPQNMEYFEVQHFGNKYILNNQIID